MTEALSRRERFLLALIEEHLREEDAVLDRRLRSMRRHPLPPRTPLRDLCLAVCILGATSLALLVPAALTSSPAWISSFAAAWVLMLACLVCLVCRWSRRRREGR